MSLAAARRGLPGALIGALLGALLGLGAGCGGTLREASVGGVASFENGKEAFDRGDWLDAIADFKAYVEQFPGTEKTDDALFYLGEAYFRVKDYALASGQYDRLTRDFPTSPFHPDALFQLARCDDLQSRPAALDQTETLRAIARYREFVNLYPEHPRAAEGRKRLQALTDRLAEKRFRNGRLYARLKQLDAAEHYLTKAIQEYPDSRWAWESRILLARVLAKQGYREAAADTLRMVVQGGASVPEGTRREAAARLREIEKGND